MDTRLALLGVVAFFAAPLLRTCESPGALADIASWALSGPNQELPAPVNGVFVFRGLNPTLLVDMTYSHSYRPATRSFMLDSSRAFVWDFGASTSQYTGEFRMTSPTPDLSGKVLSLVSRVMRAQLKFTFNEDYTSAEITPYLISAYFPLNWVVPLLIKEQVVAHKGGWKRINFAPPSNSTPTDAHYYLAPVVTRNAKGKAVVNGNGLQMAKRKLAMGSGEMVQCR
jgi:hypothetical protein